MYREMSNIKAAKMDKNIPYQLLAASFEGNIGPEQREELNSWLREDITNGDIMKELEKIWQQTGRLSQEFSPDPFVALSKVHNRIGVASSTTKVISISKNLFYLKIAASILIVLGVAYFLTSTQKTKILTASTTNAKIIELVLPDNSQVVLNKNSSLHYPEKFIGNERRLQLSGEALFTVTSNKKKPFIIEAGNTETLVLGTHFNLMAYVNSDSIIINLIEGKVQFSAKNNTEKIVLVPGEKAIYIKSSAQLFKLNEKSQNVTSWQTRKLLFENTSLNDVCADLSRVYGITVCTYDSSLAKLRFNGQFENQKLSVILESIEQAMNIKAEVHEKSIVFKNQQ